MKIPFDNSNNAIEKESVRVFDGTTICDAGSDVHSLTFDFASEPSNVRRHYGICTELVNTYRAKNADYGDSFHATFLEEGMAMSRIRLSDKLNRFKRLTKCNDTQVKSESIRDTLIDLANYAIMTVIEIDREQLDDSNGVIQ